MSFLTPPPHASGATPPQLPAQLVPGHIAIVMDGNGRWANERGLPRTEGHRKGEEALLDVVAGALDIGVKHLSAYAFSTENWRRSPAEVSFILGFSREVLRKHQDMLHSWGVRIQWAGRRPRLWGSVIRQLEEAAELTKHNDRLTLTMCINYGGRAEIADAAAAIAADVAAGRISGRRVSEEMVARYLYQPQLPDVDMVWRTGGEHRLSNFLLWQAAYAELVFTDEPWPEADRRALWRAIELYARRDRRFGGAVDSVRS